MRSHAEHCSALVARGFCCSEYEHLRDMAKFCPGACSGSTSSSALPEYDAWRKLSLHDFRKRDISLCRTRVRADCSDVENLSRIKDVGWAIRRGMVPREELDAMVTHVGTLQEPVRSNCGASGYHPAECTVTEDEIRSLFPRFQRRLTDMLEGWISSGFYDESHLGWPLRMEHGEFISLNPWKRSDASPECIVKALFLATHDRDDPLRRRCLALAQHDRPAARPDEEKLAEEQLRCWWASVTRLPSTMIHQLVDAPKCARRRPVSLGFMRRWKFSPRETDERPPLWDEMGVWLTTTLNNSKVFQAAQGFHNWHLVRTASSASPRQPSPLSSARALADGGGRSRVPPCARRMAQREVGATTRRGYWSQRTIALHATAPCARCRATWRRCLHCRAMHTTARSCGTLPARAASRG